MKKAKVKESGTAGWLAKVGKVLIFTVVLSMVIQGWQGQNEAQAAITAAQPFPNTPTISGTTAASVSGSYTVNAGSNRLLVVVVSTSFNATPTTQSVTATWGGQALTQMIVSPVNQRRFSWIGYLKEAGIAAASGTTLQVTLANNTALQGTETRAAVLTGVDQTSTVNATYSFYDNNTDAVMNFGTGLAVQAGGFALFGVSVNNTTAPTITVDTGYTLTTMDQIAATADRAFTGAKAFGSAGTANPTMTYGANIRGGLASATLNPAAVATNGTIALSAATYAVGEAGPTVTITATRTGGSTGIVGISYATSNGSSVAGSDYTSKSGTLSWGAGITTNQTFTVAITDDTVYEANETFNVTLSSPTGGATLGSPSSAVVTITENDAQPNVQFQAATSSGNEAVSPASFTVLLSGQTKSAVTVNYVTSNGTATAADYTTKSGTLTIPALSTTGTITVTVLNDAISEPNETFRITLSAPTIVTLGTTTVHTYTINNDDGAPPAMPTGVTLSNMKTGGPTITWNTVVGATSYNVYRSTDGSTWNTTIGGGTALSYTDTAAPKHNTVYYWTVTAVNANGESTKPAGVSGRTALYPGYSQISAPYNLTGVTPISAFGSWANWAWKWDSASNVDPDNSGTWNTPTEVTPGKGLFIWSYNDATVLTASGSANTTPLVVTLVPGWNMISNPLTSNMTNMLANWRIDGATTLTNAITGSIIDGALLWWDGNLNTTLLISGNPTIEPWKSYYILNRTGVNHTLTIQ